MMLMDILNTTPDITKLPAVADPSLPYIAGAALAVYIFKAVMDYTTKQKDKELERKVVDHLTAQTTALHQLNSLQSDNNKALGQLTTSMTIAMERQVNGNNELASMAENIRQMKAQLPVTCRYQRNKQV